MLKIWTAALLCAMTSVRTSAAMWCGMCTLELNVVALVRVHDVQAVSGASLALVLR